MVLGPPEVKERLWTECRKTKAKEITLANHKGHRRSSEPIKNLCNYIHLTQSAGNMCEWITTVVLFWLAEKVARIFLNQSYKVVDAKPISSTRKGKHSIPQLKNNIIQFIGKQPWLTFCPSLPSRPFWPSLPSLPSVPFNPSLPGGPGGPTTVIPSLPSLPSFPGSPSLQLQGSVGVVGGGSDTLSKLPNFKKKGYGCWIGRVETIQVTSEPDVVLLCYWAKILNLLVTSDTLFHE